MKSASDFDNMIPVLWAAYTHPPSKIREFVYPVKGTSKEALEEAMEDCKKRIIKEHNNIPISYWIQVVETGTENEIPNVVGAANWHIFYTNKVNPHAKDSYEPCEKFIDWWPEGSVERKIYGENVRAYS